MEVVYLSCADVAKMTGKKVETVRRWCRTGALKSFKPNGKDVFIKADDLAEFMCIADRDDAEVQA